MFLFPLPQYRSATPPIRLVGHATHGAFLKRTTDGGDCKAICGRPAATDKVSLTWLINLSTFVRFGPGQSCEAWQCQLPTVDATF